MQAVSKKTKNQPEAAPQSDELKEEKLEEAKPEGEKAEEPVNPIEELEQTIETLQQDLAKAKTDAARAWADADNTRKRLLKEADANKKYRFQSAALELLPVLDSMNLALSAQPESDEAKGFVKGFEMIRQQLENVLDKEGVKEVNALDQPFDSNTMQALMKEKKEGTAPGQVIEVLQKGYLLKDRILRPALVKVSE
jgi:molecular chaperone GrpE